LGRILSDVVGRVAALRAGREVVGAMAGSTVVPGSFAAVLIASYVKIIAEIKRRAPSAGVINPALSAPEHAEAYVTGGAAAISVLTEPYHFGGSGSDLADVRRAVDVPLLRKDFVVDPLQIVEARALGASAVLLIARAVPPGLLLELASVAREWRMEALIEVRTDRELERAVAAKAPLIGVNSRNLETLEVDIGVTARLLPLVPRDRIAIAESAVRTVADVEGAAAAGADAVLVGSAVSRAPDPAGAVRALVGVARRGR
jgi:indole-3-glycerol phosphate synthase